MTTATMVPARVEYTFRCGTCKRELREEVLTVSGSIPLPSVPDGWIKVDNAHLCSKACAHAFIDRTYPKCDRINAQIDQWASAEINAMRKGEP